MTMIKSGAAGLRLRLKGYEAALEEVLGELEGKRFPERLHAKDASLWKDSPEEQRQIADSLGWLTLPGLMQGAVPSLASFAKEVRASGFPHVVLLGMGGSSLAPLVYSRVFASSVLSGPHPRLMILDSTDPDAVSSVDGIIDPARTLFIVSSKSGTTVEPLSLLEHFYERAEKAVGPSAGAGFVAITDPGTRLEDLSRRRGFKRVFLNPPDVGGRYSALSYFGLAPAAAMGVDAARLLERASSMASSISPGVDCKENPAVLLGAAMGALCRAGRDKLTILAPKGLSSLGLWAEQLLAESTGKEGKGVIPIAGEQPADAARYGADRAFVYIGIGRPGKEAAGLLDALSEAGHPVMDIRMKDEYDLGGEFLRWEAATAATGVVLGINPFDQPDVELAKRLARARLDAPGKGAVTPPAGCAELAAVDKTLYIGRSARAMTGGSPGMGRAPQGEAALREALSSYLGLVKGGDYIALLPYFNPLDIALEAAFSGLQAMLRDKTGAATQLGFGPRYLHSTGQIHKGGPGSGVFMIITHGAGKDVPIPGAHYGFSALELSQAFGDMEALDSKGRRVALLHLKDSSASAVAGMEALFRGALTGR
jgi:glucose-6-phosphate isomerase